MASVTSSGVLVDDITIEKNESGEVQIINTAIGNNGMIHLYNIKSENGTWLNSNQVASSYQSGRGRYNSSKANGDYTEYYVYLVAGTYDLFYYHDKSTQACIIDTEIDGSSIDTNDCYAASDSNNHQKKITGITISTSGIKTLKFLANGKNASSSAYRMVLFDSVQFVRTA